MTGIVRAKISRLIFVNLGLVLFSVFGIPNAYAKTPKIIACMLKGFSSPSPNIEGDTKVFFEILNSTDPNQSALQKQSDFFKHLLLDSASAIELALNNTEASPEDKANASEEIEKAINSIRISLGSPFGISTGITMLHKFWLIQESVMYNNTKDAANVSLNISQLISLLHFFNNLKHVYSPDQQRRVKFDLLTNSSMNPESNSVPQPNHETYQTVGGVTQLIPIVIHRALTEVDIALFLISGYVPIEMPLAKKHIHNDTLSHHVVAVHDRWHFTVNVNQSLQYLKIDAQNFDQLLIEMRQLLDANPQLLDAFTTFINILWERPSTIFTNERSQFVTGAPYFFTIADLSKWANDLENVHGEITTEQVALINSLVQRYSRP